MMLPFLQCFRLQIEIAIKVTEISEFSCLFMESISSKDPCEENLETTAKKWKGLDTAC